MIKACIVNLLPTSRYVRELKTTYHKLFCPQSVHYSAECRPFLSPPEPTTDVMYSLVDFSLGPLDSGLGALSDSAPPAHILETLSVRRSSPRLATKSSSSITQKAICRKAVLREGSGARCLEGPHTSGSKRIMKKSKKCGVLLSSSEAQVLGAFLESHD